MHVQGKAACRARKTRNNTLIIWRIVGGDECQIVRPCKFSCPMCSTSLIHCGSRVGMVRCKIKSELDAALSAAPVVCSSPIHTVITCSRLVQHKNPKINATHRVG